MLYNVPGRTGCNIDAATCAKLATIPHVIGVKEASGNITQMVEICRAVPADFLVLSGDDALTLPLMAIGGRGLISVASNAIPAEMSQMVEAAERGDFAAARQMHHRLVPLMLGNFIESNPGPVKFAMAAMGLCEEVVPPADGVAAAGLAGEDSRVPEGALRALSLQSTIEALAAAGAGADRAAGARRIRRAEGGARKRHGPIGGARSVVAHRLARQHLGQAGHPARIPLRRSSSIMSAGLPFYDKDTQSVQRFGVASASASCPADRRFAAARIVARGVICVPPMYINIGAYIGEGSLVDSHALVGSCAQIGARVHVSAAAQIGGVLEPVGAMPVIVEDDVLVGGNTGIYEGAVIKQRAVIAAGTVLTGSTPVYDLVNGTIIKPAAGQPLVIPQGAVVVPGARAVTVGAGKEWGLSLATPVIVKYRDDKTDARTELEQWIR